MAVPRYKTENHRAIERVFRGIAREVSADQALRTFASALRTTAKPLRTAIRANTPVGDGTLRRAVRTVTQSLSRSRRNAGAAVYVGWFIRRGLGQYNRPRSTGEDVPRSLARQLAVEEGTQFQAAQAPIRKAFNSLRNSLRGQFVTNLGKALHATIKRAVNSGAVSSAGARRLRYIGGRR